MDRQEWGADPSLPRRGDLVDAAERSEVFIHHTFNVDDDATPNEYEDLEVVKAKMRALQRARPDLGLDVPYSFVAFCMADGELVLGEGRGFDRSGAHSVGHNRSAFGIALQGDFEGGPAPAHFDSQLAALGDWLRSLRETEGYTRLGASRPPDRQVWAHMDIKATLCPGRLLVERLGRIRFLDEEDEMAMDQATWKKVQSSLQALDPPLYAGQPVDGLPGRNTNISVQAFERRVDLEPRGVIGASGQPTAGIWPATRELLFLTALHPPA